MKLLADENFPRPTVEILCKQGHDVLWARLEFPGWKDLAVLEQAEIDGRLIQTLDRYFWQLAVQRRSALKRSGVVLFRVHPAVPERLAPLVHSMLGVKRQWIGHVSIITTNRIEMIPVHGDPADSER